MTTKDCKEEVGVRENRSTFYFVCVRAWVVWGLGEVWWSREIEDGPEMGQSSPTECQIPSTMASPSFSLYLFTSRPSRGLCIESQKCLLNDSISH